MERANIDEAKAWFEVLQTTERAQTAMMTLGPGHATGEKAEAHPKSDQVLLVLEGELRAEIADEGARLGKGDVIVITAGTKHRFTNLSAAPAVTFNVYTPPAYPPRTKE
jgi:mannose-6-phosphate isomerase-like protein (cupin superfamily)